MTTQAAQRASILRGIHAIDGPADALAYLERHAIPIEALALAGERPELRAFAIDSGANRIASFGDLQRPLLAANHGGRARVLDYVRWVTDER